MPKGSVAFLVAKKHAMAGRLWQISVEIDKCVNVCFRNKESYAWEVKGDS